MYCVAAIGPINRLDRQLYKTADEARSALVGELKKLRANHPDDAEEINGVLDEVEVSEPDFFIIFNLDGQEWTTWYQKV